MKKEFRFRQSEQEQQVSQEQLAQQKGPQEFASVEHMLRHDAMHTPVPPNVGHRLAESINGSEPPPRRSWWQRWFGAGS